MPLLTDEGFVSYFVAPLLSKGQVKGVLEFSTARRFKRDDEWLEYLETMAVQAAIAIDNAAMFEGLQRSNLELAWRTTPPSKAGPGRWICATAKPRATPSG